MPLLAKGSGLFNVSAYSPEKGSGLFEISADSGPNAEEYRLALRAVAPLLGVLDPAANVVEDAS